MLPVCVLWPAHVLCDMGSSCFSAVCFSSAYRLSTSAREMVDGRVCLQLRIVSQLAWPAMLTSANLALQPGFALASDLAQAAGLLPCQVCS